METKLCKHCGRELPVEMFNKASKSKDGLQPYCRECQKEMNAAAAAARKSLKVDKKVDEGNAGDAVRLNGSDAVKIVSRDGDKVLTNNGRILTKVKMLEDYTSRELLQEIKRRGYVWDSMWIKQNINYKKI